MSLAMLLFLIGEFWITAAKLIIRNIGVYVFLIQVLHIGFIGKSCIGGDDDFFFIYIITQAEALIAIFNGG